MSGFVSPRGDLEDGDFPSKTWHKVLLGLVIAVVLSVAVYLGVR